MFCIPIGITNPVIGLKICAITAVIKKYNSIIKKNEKKHDKIVLLSKSKLDIIEVLISTTLINSNISHNKFVSIYNMLKEYDDIEKRNKKINRPLHVATQQFIEDSSLLLYCFLKKE